jgi:SsrA-binding protein
VALLGTEVKSIREGGANLRDSFARVEGARCGSTTSTSAPTAIAATAITSRRAAEAAAAPPRDPQADWQDGRAGMTLVPVRMYLKNGRVKVAISLAKGKKAHDKRETIKRRETDRETRAAVKERRR